RLDLQDRTATRNGQVLNLTPREFDLLAYLAALNGEVASRESIQKEVWKVQSRMTSMDNVIDVHVSRLRQKLGEAGDAPILHTVRGVGIVLREEA
ncbi:MAG: winged helix-turn-helix domain-containing protein, partial [Anaerolineae bacterium]